MFRHGVAAAALVFVMAGLVMTGLIAASLLTAGHGSALAQSADHWSAAVFVPTGPGSTPVPLRVADTRSRHAPAPDETGVPPLPVRKSPSAAPAKAAAGKAADDKTTASKAPAGPAPAGEADIADSLPKPKPKPEEWSPGEIAAAKARCTKLLKGLDAVVVPQLPIRDGRCGTPAPIRLVKLGKVEFTPAALLDCEMAATLSRWIKKDLQPLAMRHLGARIAKIEVMSDYSCRNVFGTKRLSEHSYANALDIRGFVTERGQTARVLDNWGKTKFDIAAEMEAAKAKAKAEAAAAGQDAGKATAALPETRKRNADQLRLAADKLNGPPEPPTPKRDAQKQYAALGPQPGVDARTKVAPPHKPALDRNARFLHAAHAAACRIFGTTLGPEANKAHRNHFHVDMAERKWKKICD